MAAAGTAPPAPREPGVGDLVRCRSTAYASALGAGGLIGVVLEPRSAHSLVFFAERQASYWLPTGALAIASPAESAAAGSELQLISRLLILIEATDVQIDATSPDRLLIEANHGALPVATLDAAGRLLGENVPSYVVQPGGMAFMTSTIILRRPPAA